MRELQDKGSHIIQFGILDIMTYFCYRKGQNQKARKIGPDNYNKKNVSLQSERKFRII